MTTAATVTEAVGTSTEDAGIIATPMCMASQRIDLMATVMATGEVFMPRRLSSMHHHHHRASVSFSRPSFFRQSLFIPKGIASCRLPSDQTDLTWAAARNAISISERKRGAAKYRGKKTVSCISSVHFKQSTSQLLRDDITLLFFFRVLACRLPFRSCLNENMFRFSNSKREIRILSARLFSSEVQGRNDKKEASEIGSRVEGTTRRSTIL